MNHTGNGKKQGHSPEVKAQVMAALLAGQSIREVARDYNISKSTVGAWAKEKKDVQYVPDTKKEEIGDLIVEYLRTMLRTLITQAEHFGDKQWLTAQGADQLAVLHGVAMDKTIRILEAIESKSDSADG